MVELGGPHKPVEEGLCRRFCIWLALMSSSSLPPLPGVVGNESMDGLAFALSYKALRVIASPLSLTKALVDYYFVGKWSLFECYEHRDFQFEMRTS